jgi:hypothetical protein
VIFLGINKKANIMFTTAIKETLHTPSVNVFNDDNLIVVSGTSRLEDPSIFYQELAEIFEGYIQTFKEKITLDFNLNYINTSSSKWLFHILKNLQVNYSNNINIVVNWYYEEDDEVIQEAGEVFGSLLELPFNLVPIE